MTRIIIDYTFIKVSFIGNLSGFGFIDNLCWYGVFGVFGLIVDGFLGLVVGDPGFLNKRVNDLIEGVPGLVNIGVPGVLNNFFSSSLAKQSTTSLKISKNNHQFEASLTSVITLLNFAYYQISILKQLDEFKFKSLQVVSLSVRYFNTELDLLVIFNSKEYLLNNIEIILLFLQRYYLFLLNTFSVLDPIIENDGIVGIVEFYYRQYKLIVDVCNQIDLRVFNIKRKKNEFKQELQVKEILKSKLYTIDELWDLVENNEKEEFEKILTTKKLPKIYQF